MLKDFFSVPVYIHNFNYDTNLLSKSCFQYMTDNREVIEKEAGEDIKSIYDKNTFSDKKIIHWRL